MFAGEGASARFSVQSSGEIKVTLTRTPRRQVPKNQTLLACPRVTVHRPLLLAGIQDAEDPLASPAYPVPDTHFFQGDHKTPLLCESE